MMQMIIQFPSGLRIEVKNDGELQDLKPLVVKESETVPIGAVIQEVSSEHSEKAQILEVPKTKKPAEVPLSQEMKKEILQLAEMGLRPKEIANKLGIQDARQVVGTIYARAPNLKQKGRVTNQSSEDTPKIPEAMEVDVEVTEKADPEVTLEVIKEATPEVTSDIDLDARILEMYSRLTLKEISAQLEKEGIDLTPKEVSQKVKGIQLRKLGKQTGQTVEQRVPERANVAESIPAPENVARRSDSTSEVRPEVVQDCAALQGGGSVGQLLEKPGCPGGDGPAQEGVPEASAYSPMAVNGQIWDLTRAGLSPAEIAGELHERGLQWTEDMVEKRLEKIRAGAA